MEEEKRTCVKPDEFAIGFAKSIMSGESFNEKTIVEDSKEYLISYLTAYYLAQDFNKEERRSFTAASQGKEKHFKDLSFEQLLERIRALNKY